MPHYELLNTNLTPAFSTEYGDAYCADSAELLKGVRDQSIDLIMTSPPFALVKKKEYGNVSSDNYVNWFMENFSHEFYRVLKPRGSLVIDLGGAWIPGKPTRSLYQFELLTRLCKESKFFLAQEFYWYNPAKMPSPAQWVTIDRIRVKDSVNTLWWLSKTEQPKANNRRVLTPYKNSMKELLKKGYNQGLRPSGHDVSDKWGKDNGGAIPSNFLNYREGLNELLLDNLLEIANTGSYDKYLNACRALGIRPHPARFPYRLPEFFIEFLTDPNDTILDPFAGSCMTGAAAEDLHRNWVTSELNPDYVSASRYRFFDYTDEVAMAEEVNETE